VTGLRVLLLLICLAAPALAAEPQDLAAFQAANAAYKAGEFDSALSGYRKLAEGVHNPELYLNLGNAAFKTGQLGWAILYYERGLALQPRNPELRESLRFARERIVDRSADDAPGLAGLLSTLHRQLALDELMAVTSALWLLTLLAAGAVYRQDLTLGQSLSALLSFLEVPWKQKLAAMLAPCLLAFGLCGGWAYVRLQDSRATHAIVLAKEAKASSAPATDATVVFAVHEGTRVAVLRRSDRWSQVSLANGYSGWVLSDAIQEI
jgi:tetratricopeptide (TPR) repeat protein